MMDSKRSVKIAKSIAMSLALLLLAGCGERKLYSEKRAIMGTSIEVVSPYGKAAEIVFGEFNRVEDLLSKYKPSSEVYRLNKNGGLKVSRETFCLIKKAKDFYQATDGAFDVTIGPLVDLWGFTDRRYSYPPREDVRRKLKLVGSDKIILNDKDCMVKFMLSGMRIDLGGIAKGYALDCAIKKLKENNINSCLINAGGQVSCLGDKFGKPWNIAIASPRGKGTVGCLGLKDRSIATSGDYQRYFIKDKKRYSHILNPKTGRPADTDIASVTVVAEDGLTADVLATAMFILGREGAWALADKFPGVTFKIIEDQQQ